MRPDQPMTLWTRMKRGALGFDAWLNSFLFDSGRGLGDVWESYSRNVNRLKARGAWRVVLDLTSEATTLGVAGGIVMVMLAMPAFRETSDDWLKTQELAVTFLDRYGQEIGRRGIRHDDSYKLEEFPDYLVKAALATEDRRFYDHWGIDPIGTFRALTVNARGGGVVQGGSSITQQLAKNLFLTNERSIERKIKEAFLALWLEFHLTKDEILKLYLDRAYMGGGTHGVVAAAEYYFGKSAKDLTLAESAMLAGLFKAPTKFAPHINLPAARARANDVLSNMVEAGFLTEGQIQTARRNPATPVDPQPRDDARLLSRLGLRAGEAACRRRQVRRRARPRREDAPRQHDPAPQRADPRGHAAPVRSPVRCRAGCDRASWTSTARCARWSAGATTGRASSTAPSMRCASPARRSSRSSTRRR